VIEGSRELFDHLKDYKEINAFQSLKLVFLDSRQGASFARNIGAKEESGEIVAFVDDDVVLSPDWAENLVKPYRLNSVVGVTGQVLPLWEEKGWEWFPEEFDWVFGCSRWLGLHRITEVRSVIGANASFRKEAFNLAGGYLTKLGACHLQHEKSHELHVFGEETELSIRTRTITGGIILYTPRAKVYHKVQRGKLSWRFISQRAYQVGRTRRLLSAILPKKTGERKLFETEYLLFGRVLSRITRSSLKNLLWNPVSVSQKASASFFILFLVFLGFVSPLRLKDLSG